MAKAKKKLLPKNFEELLKKGNLAKLKAVFDTCDVNARGGYAKQTALAFQECPDELARWLVAQGADLSATDTWHNTPLHSRARGWRGRIAVLLELGADIHSTSSGDTPLHVAAAAHKPESARLLLEHGARVNALNERRLTPLQLALASCENVNLESMAPLAQILLDAGAKKTPRMKGLVTEIGKRFEFHRSNFNRASVAAASKALEKLYEIFDVEPVPRRAMHDGKSPIVVKAKKWQKQHQELWELLVPSSGPADTVQGEVIRISGKISRELLDNGGANWDADYKKMAGAFLEYVASRAPLSPEDLKAAKSVVAEVKRGHGDTARLCEWAVAWVLENPAPAPLKRPAYRR